MCNNAMFTARTIFDVAKLHPSMAKLYEIAKAAGVKSPSALSRVLNVSPQRIQNWESRGISKEGAMAAQARFGCDANELRAQAEVAFFVDVDAAASKVISMEPTRAELRQRALDVYTEEAILIFETMRPDDRRGALAALRSYVHNLGPPRDGQTLSMAG